ncbi:MAG: hypothetical protein AAF493_12515 [Pseudomonadota bacterium]
MSVADLVSRSVMVVLAGAISAPAFLWALAAWRDSPLDRQGPLFILVAVLLLLVTSRDRVRGAIHFSALFLGVLAYLGAKTVAINLLFAVALVCMTFFLCRLFGWTSRSALGAAALIGLAMPTTAFLLGRLSELFGLAGLADGVVWKWPIAAVFVGLSIWYLTAAKTVGVFLIALVPSALAFALTRDFSTPDWVNYWVGVQPVSSTLALVASTAAVLSCRKLK